MGTPRFLDPEKQALAERFAAGRLSAVQRNIGPDHGWADRWFPTVAGRGVRNTTDPKFGFETRAEAIAAAKTYRESCREFLAGSNEST